jgi:hypothetical protein
MVATDDAPHPVPLVASNELSSEEWRGDHRFRSSGPPLGAPFGSKGDAELDVIARQTDSAMLFAMNKFGPLLDGRRFWPPVPSERGRRHE